jgi:hypothetical protein
MFVEEATDLHAWHFAKRFYLLRFEVVNAVHTVAVDYPQVILRGQVHS